MPLNPGTKLGPYEIGELLGAGGMGEVYRARDKRLARTVAIKVLLADKVADQERKRRFIQEARAASALNHPNIVTLYDIAAVDGLDYLVMEYIEGKPLDQKIGRNRLPLEQALDLAIQIASALSAAYAVGIVHRDIKPANIIVTADLHVKLLDFGLAKLAERTGAADAGAQTQTALTEHGVVMGTVAYMSPEQAVGHVVDHRTDIFSLGVVLFELLSGKRPFSGDSSVEIMHGILHEPQPRLTTIPPELEEILFKALAKDPKDRYQHAGDFGLDLRRFQHGWKTGSLSSVRAGALSLPMRWLPFMVAAIVLGIVVGTTWSFTRHEVPWVNPLENAVFTRLTDFAGSELAAEISPDGKFVAFLADRDGPFDLFVSQVGSGHFQNLTQGKTGELLELTRSTGFSGDGSEIWLRGGPDPVGLNLIPLMGGVPRPFLHAVAVSLSPDGTKIVYHQGAPLGDPMFVADRTGANAKQIFIEPNPGGHCHYPVWSKDGKWIYFVRGNLAALDMDLWRIPPEGGQPERLTHHHSNVAFPAPLDIHTVLYVATSEDGSGPWLYALDVEHKVSRRVTIGLERYLSVAASADGRRAVATVANPSASLWSVPVLDHPAEEQDVKPYPLPTVRALGPRFGADSLFYLSALGGGDGLWRYRNNQVLEIWKGSDGALLAPAAISADGRHVAIALRKQGRVLLNMMSDDGLGLTPLSNTLDVRGSAAWSPDDRWIATGGQDEKGPGLFKIPVQGGTPVRLTNVAAFNPVWSPDGTLIVYSGAAIGRYQPLLSVRPDGTALKLPDIKVRADGERYRFLPNGMGLVYMDGFIRHLDFRLLDLTTMKTRPLTHLNTPSTMRTFDLTPDSKRIVFDRLRENSDIVIIDLPTAPRH
jgi:Tol biopolymer transport system component/tRNA A-37 threonylcarbamoyl transferase component Bud32